jgi:hypothetical protein
MNVQAGVRRPLGGDGVTVNKVNWSQAGRVTTPGRYMFKFGWLTITEAELAIWQQFPQASFTLYRPSGVDGEDEYRLGSFDLPEDPAR